MGFKSITELTKKASPDGLEKLPVSIDEYLETEQISDISIVKSRPELYDWSLIEKVFDLKDIFYDAPNKCYSYRHPDGGIIQIGQQLDLNYTNVDTVTLTEKMLVSLVPLAGNRKGIKRLDISSKVSVENFIGMVTAPSIPINQEGRVTIIGEVDANTSGEAENAIIYGSATLGEYSLTAPAKGLYCVKVGSIAVSATNGKIVVHPYILPKLDDLSDVTNNAAHGQPLVKQDDGTWAGDDTLQIEKIIPPSGTFVLDGDMESDTLTTSHVDTDTLSATGKIDANEVESTTGFKKTSYTDNDILTANGGTIALSDLKSGIYQLYNPSDGTTVVVEINAAGDILLKGNVLIDGSTYEVEAEKISTSEQTIELRRDATTGLPLGQYAGFIIKLYDGVNDGMIVIDNDGVLRIGDIGDLQPVLTREESPVDQSPMFWNNITKRAETLVGTTTKTTPVDADAVPLKDSADNYKPKWLSWANIKSTLKTYFDTLYVALTGNQTIAGIKTFTDSPIVPDGATGKKAVNYDQMEAFVDAELGLPPAEVTGSTEESLIAKYISVAETTITADKVLTILINGKQYQINVKEVV